MYMQSQQVSVPASCLARLEAHDGSGKVRKSGTIQFIVPRFSTHSSLQDTDIFSWNGGQLSLNCGHGTWVTLPAM